MARGKRNLIVAAVFIVLVGATIVQADDGKGNGNGNGNNGNNNGKGNGGNDNGNGNNGNNNGKGNGDNNGKGNGDNNGKGNDEDDSSSTDYVVLGPHPTTGQERFFCLGKKGKCNQKTISCPEECPQRKPKKNKGCFADCSSHCETTCKYRKPKCEGYGSICYDPRLIGGEGTMFYFHGAKNDNFALVSDHNLHINAHFIGTRPSGRTRDFTWVQSLAIIFQSHSLVLAARNVSSWNDSIDSLTVRYDGTDVAIPNDGEAEWRTGKAVVERTDVANSVKLTVFGLVEIDVRVTPITAEEDRVHGYRVPAGDAFAHLETQFRFKNLSDRVEGVLGQTYRPDYVSPVKRGVPMPMMGGEDRYRTASFLSTDCASCRFRYQGLEMVDESTAPRNYADVVAQ